MKAPVKTLPRPLFTVSVPALAVVFTLAVIGLENIFGTTFSIRFPLKMFGLILAKICHS